MIKDYPYLPRIASLLAITVIVTIIVSYVPTGLGPIRVLMSLIQLAFMVVTMALTLRYVLEDF